MGLSGPFIFCAFFLCFVKCLQRSYRVASLELVKLFSQDYQIIACMTSLVAMTSRRKREKA